MIDSNFDLLTHFFGKYVPNHQIRLLYNFYSIFRRRYLIIFKKHSENLSVQKYDVDLRLCTQTQDLQIFKKLYMSEMNPNKSVALMVEPWDVSSSFCVY